MTQWYEMRPSRLNEKFDVFVPPARRRRARNPPRRLLTLHRQVKKPTKHQKLLSRQSRRARRPWNGTRMTVCHAMGLKSTEMSPFTNPEFMEDKKMT